MLCLIDRAGRDPLTPDQEANLTDLAAMVVDQLELRLAEGERTEAQKLLASVFESATGGISVTDERGGYGRFWILSASCGEGIEHKRFLIHSGHGAS